MPRERPRLPQEADSAMSQEGGASTSSTTLLNLRSEILPDVNGMVRREGWEPSSAPSLAMVLTVSRDGAGACVVGWGERRSTSELIDRKVNRLR